jgi:multiple antibiotic resistance protein
MNFEQLLNFFVSLLVICNPLAAFPVLLNLSEGRSLKEKRKIGIVAAFAVALILMLVVWIGEPFLNMLSIRVAAFQVAGGVIIFLLALSMLTAKTSRLKHSIQEHRRGSQKESIAVVPLAMPLMAGPGAISLVIVQASNFPGFMDHLFLSACALGVAFVVCIILFFAGDLGEKLGGSGVNVINRLAGLILAAMAIETLSKGLIGLFPILVIH